MALDNTWFDTTYATVRRVPDFSTVNPATDITYNSYSSGGITYHLQTIMNIDWLGAAGGKYDSSGDYRVGTAKHGYYWARDESPGGGLPQHVIWENVRGLILSASWAERRETNYVLGKHTDSSPYAGHNQQFLSFPFCSTNCGVEMRWTGIHSVYRRLRMWQPWQWYGITPARVAVAILRHCGIPADAFEQSTWSDADDGHNLFFPRIYYKREPGRKLLDVLQDIVLHTWDLLTVTMNGKLALYPRRAAYVGAYTLSSLARTDGVVSVAVQLEEKHLANSVYIGYGHWVKDSHQAYPEAHEELDSAPRDYDNADDWLWRFFDDSASIATYGTRTAGNLFSEFEHDGIKVRQSVYWLPYAASDSRTPGVAQVFCQSWRNNYAGRLEDDALLRREIRVVQDMRGVDYDCGWKVANVAVTNDGQTIPDTRCIRRRIDFRDMSVTSMLLEEVGESAKKAAADEGEPGAMFDSWMDAEHRATDGAGADP